MTSSFIFHYNFLIKKHLKYELSLLDSTTIEYVYEKKYGMFGSVDELKMNASRAENSRKDKVAF